MSSRVDSTGPLGQSQIDALVSQLEADAYGLALELTDDRERAAAALIEAFGRTAPWFSRTRRPASLKPRVEAAIKRALRRGRDSRGTLKETAAAPVADSLHRQLVDVVEENQSSEPIGHKQVFIGVAAAIVVFLAIGGFAFARWSALAAARPIVSRTNPTVNATGVLVHGSFWVRFARPPGTKPSLRLVPGDGSFDGAIWDGTTVLVDYSGLRFATNYKLILNAKYSSRYNDGGNFVLQWEFTTEGYPVVVQRDPANAMTGALRNGQVTIGFKDRPPVDPVLTISPSDATLKPGQWNGSDWVVTYTGLRPLTRYWVTVTVDYGVPKANILDSWAFTTEPGVPPLGIPLIWSTPVGPYDAFGRPAAQRLVAINWSGTVVGTMYQSGVATQSPDGSVLATVDGRLINRGGDVLPVPRNGYYPTFGDDNRSVCELGPYSGPESTVSLYFGRLQGPLRLITPLDAQANVQLVACSALSNRAVLASNGSGGGQGSIRVLQLTTGRVLYQWNYGQALAAPLTSSHDGLYVAEESESTDAQTGLTSVVTLIRRTTDDMVVARLTNQRVVSFSWDDARVVTAPAQSAVQRNEVDLVDWGSGKVLWRLAGAPGTDGSQPVYAVPQPDGASMMVAVGTQPAVPTELWLISSDGTASQIVNSEIYGPLFG